MLPTLLKRIPLLFLTALLLLATLPAQAQAGTDEQLANTLRGNGLFNVVMACIGIILIGLLIALVRLDRKVSRLEKNATHTSGK